MQICEHLLSQNCFAVYAARRLFTQSKGPFPNSPAFRHCSSGFGQIKGFDFSRKTGVHQNGAAERFTIPKYILKFVVGDSPAFEVDPENRATG